MADDELPEETRRRAVCVGVIGLVLATLVAGPALVMFAAAAWLSDLDGTSALTVILVGTVAAASVGGWLLAPPAERLAERIVGRLRG